MAEPVDLRIPFTTLLKVALTLLLSVCVIELWPVILMIIVAILLAVMLDPLAVFMERHRVQRVVRPRWRKTAIEMSGVVLAYMRGQVSGS